MKRHRYLFPLCGALLAAGVLPARAQQPLAARTAEVSLFKNGLGFVIREANVPGPGEYVLENLPAPVHGSFWILPEAKAATLQEAVAFSAPRKESEVALSLTDLLRANVGKKVEVRTEADGWVAGTILAVPEPETRMPVARAGQTGYRNYWEPPHAYRPPDAAGTQRAEAAGFVLLRTEAGTLALPPGEIKGMRSNDDLAQRVPRSEPGAALRVKVAGAGGRVRVAYLTWGLTWAPSYQIDISDPKEASLRCKAVLINDVETLESATAHFITGFPNLAFAEAVDPLALIGDTTDFLQSLLSLSQPGRRASAPTTMQQVTMNVAVPDTSGRPRLSRPGAGEAREDLFFYPQPDVSLRRGERGYYQLFAKRVPYDDVHVWEIEDSLDEQSRWRYGWWNYGQNMQAAEPEEVWHSLRLTNTGGIPWTTAPAMTVQEGRILGQDTLTYTPSGAKVLVKVTRSVDVQVEQGEVEVSRDRGARTAYRGNYDLVTIKGELRIINRKSEPVTMLIKKTLSGEVLESKPKAAIETTVKGVWRVNPQQLLTFEVPVPAAGKAYATYHYQVHAAR